MQQMFWRNEKSLREDKTTTNRTKTRENKEDDKNKTKE